jgi:DnaJ-class molecular chaperone
MPEQVKECPFCFGTGRVYKDIGDNNDVDLECDDCRGTGTLGEDEEESQPCQNK